MLTDKHTKNAHGNDSHNDCRKPEIMQWLWGTEQWMEQHNDISPTGKSSLLKTFLLKVKLQAITCLMLCLKKKAGANKGSCQCVPTNPH